MSRTPHWSHIGSYSFFQSLMDLTANRLTAGSSRQSWWLYTSVEIPALSRVLTASRNRVNPLLKVTDHLLLDSGSLQVREQRLAAVEAAQMPIGAACALAPIFKTVL